MADDKAGGKEGRCCVEEVEVVAEGRWLALHRHHWRDHTGRRRVWEVASCPKTKWIGGRSENTSGRRCVAVVATLSRPHPHPPALVLVKQFRPTLDAYTIELPAGLVEEEESVEEAAVRELKEETGLEGSVSITSPATALDPGTSDGRVWFVALKAECGGGDGEASVPKVFGVEGEHTELLLLPLSSLATALGELSARGCMVDSRVQALMMGMNLATSVLSSS